MPISQSTSTYLNALRFLAAMAVVLFHFKDKHFGPDWLMIYFPSNGHGWVVVFFVMSGFVISMVAEQRSAIEFAKDRAIRIYLVALPVLFLSFVLSIFLPTIGGTEYAKAIGAPLPTYALNAIFLSQSWSFDYLPFLDGPYWSLSYEVMYYVIFGAAFYADGPMRIALVGSTVLLAGPKIIALFPCWLAGALAYQMRGTMNISPRTGFLVWIASPVVLVLLFRAGIKDAANSFECFNGTYSEGYVRSWIVALAVAVNLWGGVPDQPSASNLLDCNISQASGNVILALLAPSSASLCARRACPG
jgi:peptidoglycan/LPS O-acetylase OafA/YrhL